MTSTFDSTFDFCRSLYTYWPNRPSSSSPTLPGLFMFILGCLQFVALICIAIYLIRQYKRAKSLPSSSSSPSSPSLSSPSSSPFSLSPEDDSPNPLLFPIFYKVLIIVAIAALWGGLVNTLFPFALFTGNSLTFSLIFGSSWGLYHFVVEGITFLLLNQGVGWNAAYQSTIFGLLWGIYSFVTCTLSFYYQDTLQSIILSSIWNGTLFFFYLILWLSPLSLIFRRPSLYPYAQFWCINKFLMLTSSLLTYFDIGFGFCLTELSTSGILAPMIPLICYWALLRDAKYWQGLLMDKSMEGGMYSGNEDNNDNHNNNHKSNHNNPLSGTSLLPSSAVAIAHTIDSSPSFLLGVSGYPYRTKHGVDILNFAYLSIDQIAREYSSNRETHVVIGAGSSSRVFRGTYRGRKVAVKMIFCPELTKETIDTFYHEATLLHNLKHENIVQIMGICVLPPSICMVMELCEGNLYEWIRERKGKKSAPNHTIPLSVSPLLQLSLVSQMCQSVSYLHQRDPPLLHLDIKSSNFLITHRKKEEEKEKGKGKKGKGKKAEGKSQVTGGVSSGSDSEGEGKVSDATHFRIIEKQIEEEEENLVCKLADLEWSREIVVAESDKRMVNTNEKMEERRRSSGKAKKKEREGKKSPAMRGLVGDVSHLNQEQQNDDENGNNNDNHHDDDNGVLERGVPIASPNDNIASNSSPPSLSTSPSSSSLSSSSTSLSHLLSGSPLSGFKLPETLYWLSPEVMMGHPYDTKSDIYSLTMVIWELYSGEVPYKELEERIGKEMSRRGMSGSGKSKENIIKYLYPLAKDSSNGITMRIIEKQMESVSLISPASGMVSQASVSYNNNNNNNNNPHDDNGENNRNGVESTTSSPTISRCTSPASSAPATISPIEVMIQREDNQNNNNMITSAQSSHESSVSHISSRRRSFPSTPSSSLSPSSSPSPHYHIPRLEKITIDHLIPTPSSARNHTGFMKENEENDTQNEDGDEEDEKDSDGDEKSSGEGKSRSHSDKENKVKGQLRGIDLSKPLLSSSSPIPNPASSSPIHPSPSPMILPSSSTLPLSSPVFIPRHVIQSVLQHFICHLHYRPPIPSHCPAEIRELIMRGWEGKGEGRWSAEEMVRVVEMVRGRMKRERGEEGRRKEDHVSQSIGGNNNNNNNYVA